jgi:hypothetical protein
MFCFMNLSFVLRFFYPGPQHRACAVESVGGSDGARSAGRDVAEVQFRDQAGSGKADDDGRNCNLCHVTMVQNHSLGHQTELLTAAASARGWEIEIREESGGAGSGKSVDDRAALIATLDELDAGQHDALSSPSSTASLVTRSTG